MARNSRTKATHSTGNNRSEHHVSPESSPHNRAGPTRSIAHAPTARSQAHETLGAMTTIIMRTSDDNGRSAVFGFIPRFSVLGKPVGYARFPRGTYRHPRIIQEHSTALPALNVFADRRGKRQSPCGFMMFHMCDAQKHSPAARLHGGQQTERYVARATERPSP